MKIEIEWTSSYSATLKIDGKKLSVDLKPGITELNGLTGKETDNTLGGMIALSLYTVIGDAMQAEAIACEETAADPSPNFTWKHLPNSVADAVSEMIR